MAVILADADPALRAVLRRALGARVERVIELGAGLDALDAVARERPSLVVLGPHLPDLPAGEIVAAVRASTTWGALGVACAARDDDELALARLTATGADAVLALPLVAEARASLRRLVARAAERSVASDAPRDVSGLVASELDSLARMLASAVRLAVGARCGEDLRDDDRDAVDQADARAAVSLVAAGERRHPAATLELSMGPDALVALASRAEDASPDALLVSLAAAAAGHLGAALVERGIALTVMDAAPGVGCVDTAGEVITRLASEGGGRIIARVVVHPAPIVERAEAGRAASVSRRSRIVLAPAPKVRVLGE